MAFSLFLCAQIPAESTSKAPAFFFGSKYAFLRSHKMM